MKGKFYTEAKTLCDAIERLASDQNALDNFRYYLEHDFDIWLADFVTSPAALADEFECFADMIPEVEQ